MNTRLWGRAGLKIRAGDGSGELGFPEMLSTPLFYRASPGDRLVLLDKNYNFNVATYEPKVDPRWMYAYGYAPEQNWTVYRKDLSGDSYRQEDYVFSGQVYFRVCLRRLDGGRFEVTEDIGNILAFEAGVAVETPVPWLLSEVRRVAERVCAMREPGEYVFLLLTDTHYTVNGTWEDTLTGIGLLSRKIGFDGIIHLGDLTDGMVPGDVTRHYVRNMLAGLKNCGAPVWLALGNHDSNYFRKNPEPFTEKEQSELYLDGRDLRYCVDMPGLRLIFLDSFDPAEKLRYGYSPECAAWFGRMLETLPAGSVALVCSHLPPAARLQYWAKALHGEQKIMAAARRHRSKILAWVNGHNHADRLDNDEGFPIVSVANAKCEAFCEHKTEGFVTPERRPGDASQELWDVLLVNPGKKCVRFVRFGAGRDRAIVDGKARWI